MFLLFTNVLMLVVGMFIDATPAIITFTPILFPIAQKLGIDPVHFGIVMVTNLGVGFVTPPGRVVSVCGVRHRRGVD